MAQLTIQQAFALAVQHQQAGRLPEAEQIYRHILTQQPGQVETLYQLGAVAYQMGRRKVAVDLIRQAISRRPYFPEAYCSLGTILREMGRLEEAVAACRQAVALKPDFPEACYNLGVALSGLGEGSLKEASAAYRQAIVLKPDFPEAYSNLGNVLRDMGQVAEAGTAYRQAIACWPDFPEAHSNLGAVLLDQGLLAEASGACRQAIALKPGYAEAYYNLGNALKEQGLPDEAITEYQRAIALKGYYAAAYSNLASALKDRGQLEESIAASRRALELAPDFVTADSSLLYSLQFHPDYDARGIYAENKRWNLRHAEALRRCIAPHGNGRELGRRLRIGYVSPDFYSQAEAFFTIPLLEHHDHAGFEIYCYSSVGKPDQVTQRLQQCADVWREVRRENDAALAQIIRDDQIDILVDLTMHMAGNRALVFARKPAPVQVCWLAYPGGTGLATMDYRLTDGYMDPVEEDDSCYSEQSVRLPDCWVVYDPLIVLDPRPVEQTGPVTFGSLNNPAKHNEPLLRMWARVLQAAPGTRLILQVLSAEQRQRSGRLMESMGIAATRLDWVGRLSRVEYLRCYDRIDIGLDPLPYNGITTTCDALYMGTPVLTCAGRTPAGRAGKAMLCTIGLSELVAHNPDELVIKAAQLAGDLPRLREIRGGLRARMMNSPLMNAPRFSGQAEAAYRAMWRRWCEETGK